MSLVLVELRSPGKEDHPSNRVTFGERLYEKKLTVCQSQELTTTLAHALIVSP